MKNFFISVCSVAAFIAVCACNTSSTAQNNSELNYENLYKTWVVDTVIVSGTEAPNMERDKNEYQFTKKESTSCSEGFRTTITSMASLKVSYTIKDGSIHFDQNALLPLTKFDEEGNLLSFMDVPLPTYKIIELTPKNLTLKSEDLVMKLIAK